MSIKKQIDPQKVPSHVAIIMDGNGRWAKNHGEPRVVGHMSGVEAVREALEAAIESGVRFLTIYAFSTENWNRPKNEVDALMDLLVSTLLKEVDALHKNEVRLNAIGDINQLPGRCSETLREAIKKTAGNGRITLTVALNYSARWDILEASRKIASQVKSGELELEDVNSELFAKNLSTTALPEPELLIRTSGELRISNFLLWEIAYTELYFTDTLWPDFNKERFFEAIVDYQQRERRFGMISEQIGASEE
ncbi:MAG: isoprenyl transferase [Cryomorphaceae bacterium]|nr:MAG: isoprenyl transferase [Cryomorphaceae bacterium]